MDIVIIIVRMGQQQLNTKKRGALLTLLLVLYGLWIAFTVLSFWQKFPIRSYGDLLYIREQFVVLPIHLSVLLGLLLWKKIAVCGFFFLPVLQIVYFNTVLIPKSTLPEILLAAVVGVVFVCIALVGCWFAIRPKWRFFE